MCFAVLVNFDWVSLLVVWQFWCNTYLPKCAEEQFLNYYLFLGMHDGSKTMINWFEMIRKYQNFTFRQPSILVLYVFLLLINPYILSPINSLALVNETNRTLLSVKFKI